MEMQRIKNMLQNDDSAVSPVIGVILMVAITVILAAVIASFVLGLGDQGDPAPNPSVDSSVNNDTLVLDFSGGDDFDAGVATIQGSINGSDVEVAMDDTGLDEVSAGDTVEFDTSTGNVSINGNMVSSTGGWSPTAGTIDNWEIEIVWDPSDQDSTVIYSDSS